MSYSFDDYRAQQIVVCVLIGIAAITGYLGNILVLVAVRLSPTLQTKTNAFVSSLAACNFLTCFTIPFHMTTILGDPPKKLGACKFFAGILISTQIVALVTLTLIAVLRACLICGKISTYEDVFSKRNVGIIIALSWIVPFLAVIVASVAGWATLGYSEKYNICIVESHKSGVASLVTGIVVGLPSLIIIVVCYASLFIHQRKYYSDAKRKFASPKSVGASPTESKIEKVKTNQNSRAKSLSEQEKKVNRNLFISVCAFLVSVLPFCVAIISSNLNAAIPWCGVLLLFNSTTNPVIYGLHHPDFHKVFKQIFTCKFSEV